MNGLGISISARDLIGYARAFKKAPDIVFEELTRTTWEATLLLEREVKEETPRGVGAGGGLVGSIAGREPVQLKDGVIGVVGTPMAYAEAVELGTKPHFPPIEPINDWVQTKLGIGDNESRGVAFLIARKISVKGTAGAFMFTKAFKKNKAQIQDKYQDCLARIQMRIATVRP